MTEIDTVSHTGSYDLITLAKKLNNDHLRAKLLDSLMLKKNRTQNGRKARFKVHPDTLSSSSDSDIPSEPYKNGFQSHHLYNTNEEQLNEGSVYLLPPTQFEQSRSPSDIDPTPRPQSSSGAKRKTPRPKTDEAKRKQMETKLLIVLQKIDSSVEDIRVSLGTKIVKPDGEADWTKRRKRGAEFCSRFQRNYLYQLGRQITDLQKGKSLDNTLQLLTSANQTLLQAFQAYHNYVPISFGDLVVDKLRAVVGHANDLCDVHETFLDHEGSLKKDLMDKIRRNCTIILDKANEMMSVEIELRKRSSSRTSLLSKKKKCTWKKTLSDKLSMYSIPNAGKKNLLRKKSVEKLNDTTRCSPSVQSRYKTAGFKHRPPINKSVPVKPKFPKRALMTINESPIGSPKNDDDIETIVKRHDDKKTKEQTAWEGAVCHLKGLCETITAKEENVSNFAF
ncbi:hypothetical protein RI129_009395 [Pyrocoelia pectoralis]|uniref:Uncharacterized protein n=1 Tax=Pyrocoelia pectoralis TaxID=417401 RepID=A0AAN7V8C0_9COLE